MDITSVRKFDWFGYITNAGKVDFSKEFDDHFARIDSKPVSSH